MDIIVDFVGASYWEKNLRSIALDGRIVLLGLVCITVISAIVYSSRLINELLIKLGGAVTECGFDMGTILRKRVSLVASTLRSRSLSYKAELCREVEYNVIVFSHCLCLVVVVCLT